jgi:hypothetical protein
MPIKSFIDLAKAVDGKNVPEVYMHGKKECEL